MLASKHLNDIVSEIKSLGFTKGSTLVPHNELELLVGQLTDEYFNQDCIKRKIKEVLYRFRKRISRYPKVIENFYSIFDKYGVELDNDIEPNILIDLCHDLMPIYEKHRNKAPSKRYVDFNQGIDARLLNEENIQLLSELPIRPMRIAFDHIDMKDIYIEKIRLANKYGIKELSNYILYNYEDKPEHLYIRLKINIELNEELNCKIYSFPMKYVPVTHTNRSFVGEHWNPKYLTAINKIINVAKGIVAPGKEFFEKAFGKDLEEYFKILLMPDEYILHRFDRERDGSIDSWWDSLMSLTDDEYSEVIKIIKSNNIKELNINDLTDKAKDVLLHYLK